MKNKFDNVSLSFFSKSLQIPSHISVLHVEQEVVGDNTQSLDSVLESDTERHTLLEREKQLQQLLNQE